MAAARCARVLMRGLAATTGADFFAFVAAGALLLFESSSAFVMDTSARRALSTSAAGRFEVSPTRTAGCLKTLDGAADDVGGRDRGVFANADIGRGVLVAIGVLAGVLVAIGVFLADDGGDDPFLEVSGVFGIAEDGALVV